MLDVVDEARLLAGSGHAVWSERFNEVFAQVAGEFENAGSRKRARAYLLGLLSHTERKNGWTLAEFAGDQAPDGMQRLLSFYSWDADAVRDAVRRYVVKNIGDPGAVLVADETGFLKKGRMSAGVARQYTGTAGRVENAQVGVFLAYAAGDGSRALIDRELYLPQKWTADRERCRAAGIGDDVLFATKPKLAQDMLGRAVRAGVPFAWFAADEVYGQNPGLREWLEDREIGYVMAVPCSEVMITAGRKRRADELAALVPSAAWQQLSCADGSKGPRLYDWALIGTASRHPRLAGTAAAAPRRERREGARLFPVLRPAWRGAGRASGRGRRPVGGGGLFRRGQERDRPGPLPGPPLSRLVPAHHLVHARARVPGHHRPGRPAVPGAATAARQRHRARRRPAR